MVAIDKDIGGVADDLRRLDPCLKVRFAENGRPPYWCVYWESPDKRETYLVATQQATLTRHGTWTGLDQRIVRRLEEIDPQNRSGYEYAEAVRKQNEQAERARDARVRGRLEELGEQAAHAARKDTGSKHRIFVPRGMP